MPAAARHNRPDHAGQHCAASCCAEDFEPLAEVQRASSRLPQAAALLGLMRVAFRAAVSWALTAAFWPELEPLLVNALSRPPPPPVPTPTSTRPPAMSTAIIR